MTGSGYGQVPPGGPYGQPSGYGGSGWPGQQPPPYAQGAPYYGTTPPPGYGPYPDQGGYGGARVRPPTVWVAMALLILSALPALAGAVYVLVLSAQDGTLAPGGEAGLSFGTAGDEIVRFSIGLGVLYAICALIYMALAVVAAFGKSWARTMLAVLTVLFDLPLLIAAVFWLGYGTGTEAVPPQAQQVLTLGLVLVIGVLVASVAGMVVMYLPVNRPYFATPRR
jgi:hypothetical protein